MLLSSIPSVSSLIQQGNRLQKTGKIQDAIAIYRQAIALYPSSAWSYYYLGRAFISQGSLNRATVCYRRAIRYNPSVAEFYNQLGEIYLRKEQLQKAVKYFNRAIALQPNQAWYHQNLGETLAQQGKWTPCVSEFYTALKCDRDEVVRYDRQLSIKLKHPHLIQVQNPIFIVGCGHSGTSIMLAILGNHPTFYPIPYESSLFLKTPSQIEETMLQWDEECLNAGKKRWIEKTPPHIFQIQKFLKYRPQSQFILMLRDGRDVVCSLKYRQKYKTFLERVERWIYDNLAGLPYWNHPQVQVVKYEDLVNNSQEVMKQILNFLGATEYDRILDYHQNQKQWYSRELDKPENINTLEEHKQFRNWQINQPLFDGRGRWKTEMTAAEKDIFKTHAQQYLVQFGYTNDDNW